MLLKHIKEQLQQNVLLLEDFPDACAPEGAKGRAKPWRESCILLRNQTMIHAYGAGQNLRGARHGKERPGLIVVDDLEDQEHVIVEEQRDKLSQWFNSTLLHAGHPDTNVIAVGTILHHDSLLANLTGPKSTWRKKIYRALITYSNRADLWEKWAAIYIEEEEWEEGTGADAAVAYFQANREAMLEGTEVLWPEREDYCTLMIIRQQVGRGGHEHPQVR